MIKSTFVEIINKIEKYLVAVAFTNTLNKQFSTYQKDNHLLPLLEKLSHEKKQILIMGNFNINLLNYDDKNTANLFDTVFCCSYLRFINIHLFNIH